MNLRLVVGLRKNLLAGERKLTDQTAAEIGKALGTSAELWLNLQNDYLSWKQAQSKTA